MNICRVDAGVDVVTNQISYGAYLVGNDGWFVAAINGSLNCALDPLLAEAMACKEALTWVSSRGVMEVCVQTDYLSLVQALRSAAIVRSYFGSIIHGCRTISSLFSSCVFQFIPRSVNQAAHALAKAFGS